jgi:signal transduction histidine kinase
MTTDPTRLASDLETGLRLEELLASLAAQFLNRPTIEDVGNEIEHAQRRLCELLGFDRSTAVYLDESDGSLRLLRMVQPPELPSVPEGTNLTDLFPHTAARVLNGHSVIFTSPEELPPEAATDIETFRRFGTRSSAVLPLRAGGRVIGVMTFATTHEARAWPPAVVQRLELVAGVFASALYRSNADAALREVGGRLINSQERERARLAQELHDGIGQQLAMLAVEVQLLGLRPPASGAELRAELDDLSAKIRAMSTDVHRLSHGLHPAKLARLGLVAAIRGFCRELDATERVQVEFAADDVPASIPDDRALCLYRVAQEALWNVLRHSGAQHASVILKGAAAEVTLDVIDDGVGFDPERIPSSASLGILGMRERVGMHGGVIRWDPVPGGGMAVHVRIPLPPPGPTT